MHCFNFSLSLSLSLSLCVVDLSVNDLCDENYIRENHAGCVGDSAGDDLGKREIGGSVVLTSVAVQTCLVQ